MKKIICILGFLFLTLLGNAQQKRDSLQEINYRQMINSQMTHTANRQIRTGAILLGAGTLTGLLFYNAIWNSDFSFSGLAGDGLGVIVSGGVALAGIVVLTSGIIHKHHVKMILRREQVLLAPKMTLPVKWLSVGVALKL